MRIAPRHSLLHALPAREASARLTNISSRIPVRDAFVPNALPRVAVRHADAPRKASLSKIIGSFLWKGIRGYTEPFTGKQGLATFIMIGTIYPALIFLPNWAAKIGVLLVTGVALVEYLGLSFRGLPKRHQTMSFLASMGYALALTASTSTTRMATTALLISGWTYYLFCERDLKIGVRQLRDTIFGCMFLPLGMSHIHSLHALPDGVHWVLASITATAAGDITSRGYGKAYGGKHVILPHVSEKKMWEGFVSRIAGSYLASFLWMKFAMPGVMSMADFLVLGATAAVFGLLGDLCGSMLKRSYDVKDSGKIIPGHGGVVDRIGSHVMVAPVFFYWLTWLKPLLGF